MTDVRVGATLPAGEEAKTVTLDGTRVRKPTVRETNRGVEVTVKVPVDGQARGGRAFVDVLELAG